MQNELSPESSALGGVIVAVACMQALMIICTLIAVMRTENAGGKGDSEEKQSEEKQVEMKAVN